MTTQYRILVITRDAPCGGDSHWLSHPMSGPWQTKEMSNAFVEASHIIQENGVVAVEVTEFNDKVGGKAWRIKRSN